MRKTKVLSVALAGILGLSILATPVFATEGQNSVGENSGDEITLTYNSLELNKTTDYLGKTGTVAVTEDVGYAWDDMSWTYVIENNNVTRLSTDGYEEINEESTSTGTWYRGTYTSEDQLNALTAEQKAAAQLPPVLSMGEKAERILNNQPMYSQDDLAKTPKLVLHNYSDSNTKFNFAISNSEYSNYNTNGMLMLLDEDGKDVDEFSNTFTTSGDYKVSGNITLASGTTKKYGVTPAITPNTAFESFSTHLTLNFTSAQ